MLITQWLQKPISFFKNASKKVKLIIALVLVAVIIIGLLAFFSGSGKVKVEVQSALKEIVWSSELSTAEYTYNSIAEIANDKEIECYVSYNGTVKMGVDFEKIEVKKKGNTWLVIVPEVQVNTVIVDEDMDFLFTKKKYEKEGVYQKAHAACCDDLMEKASENIALQTMTVENAVQTVEALTAPLEKTLPDKQTIQVVYVNDLEEE